MKFIRQKTKQKISTIRILPIVVLMMMLLISGCSGSDSSEGSVDSKADSSQVLNVPIEAEPASLDQAKASDWYSAVVGMQISDSLTTVVMEDGRDVIKPSLAESWDVSEDELVWTFNIRDAKWSDGEEVRAQDFEYGIRRILDPETASPISSYIKFIENASVIADGEISVEQAGVKAIDNKTLQITLEYPVPYLLEVAAGVAMQPVRQDMIEEYGSSYGTSSDKVIGCGPFVLDEWVHNSSLSFSKNPTYWDADEVKLEQLNMKIIAEESTMVGEFENGNLDYLTVMSTEWIDRLSESDEFDKEIVQWPETKYIFFNQEEELFSNDKVRRAFSIALNREEIQKSISDDREPAAYGWIPDMMAVDGENFRDMAGDPVEEIIAENTDPKALLKEGLDELGIGEEAEDIQIEMMYDVDTKDFAEYLQQSYKESLGVNIVLDPVEWPVLQERNRNLEYQMSYKSYCASYNDPSSMMDLWMTGANIVPTGWSSEEYDRLMNEANSSIDNELRKNNFKEAERILLEEDVVVAPYAYSTATSFKHKNVEGIVEPTFTSILYKYAYKK